jgi:ABC-2 type transport system permease protein
MGVEEAPGVLTTSETLRLRPGRRLRELLGRREVLANLTRKEVKVRYTSSRLGIAWAILNPILYLAVFSAVIPIVLPGRASIPDFPIYLLSGLLAWNLFSTSLSLAARSVVDNANLVKKVAFPREILPLSSIGVSVVDFGLQALVLVAFMAILRYPFVGANLLLLPLSAVALLVFTSALALGIASLNVRYRDIQHLLGLALLAWFWLTPVVYPSGLLQRKLTGGIGEWAFYLYLALNPVADVVAGFQRSIYRFVHPAGTPDGILMNLSLAAEALILVGVIAASLALLALLWRTFFRLSGDFAEEL